MSKLTKRFKKTQNNKTIKRGGADPSKKECECADSSKNENSESSSNERKGILDIVGSKLSGVASSATNTIFDTGLKIAGLERINKSVENNQDDNSNENFSKIGDSASKIVSGVGNILDKSTAIAINNVNKFLGSDAAKLTTKMAAEDYARIIKNAAGQFNAALENPSVRSEIEKSIDNAGEIGAIVIKASEKPFNEAVNVAAKAIPKATGAALSGMIKVGTDAMGAVPGLGGVIEIGKMINDTSKAASAVVEAGSEVVGVASDAFIDTKKNVDKELKDLEEKKKMSQQISERTTKSIDEFENPLPPEQVPVNQSQTTGGRKTRRKLIKNKNNKNKNKLKSKRVRFDI
jgi:hypothetical protein